MEPLAVMIPLGCDGPIGRDEGIGRDAPLLIGLLPAAHCWARFGRGILYC